MRISLDATTDGSDISHQNEDIVSMFVSRLDRIEPAEKWSMAHVVMSPLLVVSAKIGNSRQLSLAARGEASDRSQSRGCRKNGHHPGAFQFDSHERDRMPLRPRILGRPQLFAEGCANSRPPKQELSNTGRPATATEDLLSNLTCCPALADRSTRCGACTAANISARSGLPIPRTKYQGRFLQLAQAQHLAGGSAMHCTAWTRS